MQKNDVYVFFKKYFSLLFIILIVMIAGCSNRISEEDLIGGNWEVTAGFKDGKAEGSPLCPDFEKGVEFIDHETVSSVALKEKFKYQLRKTDENEMKIDFFPPHWGYEYYTIYKINDNAFGIIGKDLGKEYTENCYFERER